LPLGWGVISVEDAMRVQLPLFLLAAVAFACSIHAGPAQAQRVFVGATGSDSNPCTFASPCRSFQHAHDVAAANGEIDVLDPAGYGPLTITKAISIQGHGYSGITVASGGTAITINAPSTAKVTLNGLIIDGAGAGYNGIVFNSGGSLTITNCVAQNFVYSGSFPSGAGILIQPSSGLVDFSITSTIVTNDGGAGIAYFVSSGSPAANGVIDHVAATANPVGISIEPNATAGSTVITISNSVVSNNSNDGIFGNGPATLKLSIDNSNISGNSNYGIYADVKSNVLLGRSVITGNGTGVFNNTSPNTFYTYKDNRINENGTDTGGTALNTTFTFQ
jgi:hypothetical protein